MKKQDKYKMEKRSILLIYVNMCTKRSPDHKKYRKEDYKKKLQKEKLSGSRPKVSSLRPEELKGDLVLYRSSSYSNDSRR